MMDEFDEQEQIVLKLMFHLMHEIIDYSDGFFTLSSGESFSRNDLWKLAQKLNISDY